MDDWALISLFQRSILLLALLSAAPLLVSMAVGLFVGVLQAATSVQEATLGFLPKLLAVLLVMGLLGPTMARALSAFTTAAMQLIPELAR